ncbi:hypothetical protein [Streptomyces xantholiticus]|uniref:Uncharacterized protein n=1 Tax=Streptomyces xantholiticus TaxID=68285 RepID=A0ABV1UZZ3_9ACTN
MQTAPLFDLPAATGPANAVKPTPRVPLALGELPVSSVPAAYDREHLYSPKAGTAEHVDRRPGDLYGPLPVSPHEPKAWRAWWDAYATAETPDYLGLEVGDDITIQHATTTGPGTVVSTCRFGAVVRFLLPPGSDEPHVDMFVTARNQFGHWYR